MEDTEERSQNSNCRATIKFLVFGFLLVFDDVFMKFFRKLLQKFFDVCKMSVAILVTCFLKTFLPRFVEKKFRRLDHLLLWRVWASSEVTCELRDYYAVKA